jgi:GAF domain-containing protein
MIAFLRNTFLTLNWEDNDPWQQQRVQGLLYLLFFAMVGLLLLVLGLQIYTSLTGVDVQNSIVPIALGLIAIAPLFLLLQRGYYYTVARGVVLLGLILTYLQMLGDLGHYSSAASALLSVLAANLLLSWRMTIMTAVLVIFAASQVALVQGFDVVGRPWFAIVILVTTLTALLYIFVERLETPSKNLSREFQRFQRLTELWVLPESPADEDAIYAHVLRLLVNELGHTVAQFYRVNEDGVVRQRIGVGFYLGGLDVQEDVEISSTSGIYTAIHTRETIILNEDSSPRERRHLLPGIATGVAIPLVYQGRVLGVLDVQQNQQSLLQPSDVGMLELIARQVSTAVGQTRALDDLRFDIQQQQRTLEQQRMKLLRYEQSTQRTTLDSWSSYLQQRGLDFMGFDLQNAELSSALQMEVPGELASALEAGEITVTEEEGRQCVSVPILLNGHALGAMSFTLPPGSPPLDTRQTEMVEGAVQRLALALENKRLFEQTQSQVERERLANEVGGVLLSATDIQRMLELAADQFKDAVGAVQARISIQPEPSETMEEPS